MDSKEENTEESPMEAGSSTNGTSGRTDTENADLLDWTGDELETQSNASDDSCDDGEESDYSSTDSDGVSEKCPICLQRFSGQEIGTPETCEHYFCLECITKWSSKTATCPVDRKSFPSILVRRDLEGEVVRIQEVVFPNETPNPDGEQYDFDPTYCEICGLCDREDRLLLCDGCDLGYHLECLEPRLDYVPIEDWFCPRCQASHRAPEAAPTSSREASHRSVRVARTSQSIRILHSIARSTTSGLVMDASAMEEIAMRRSTVSSRNSSRATQRRRKPARKTRKSKTKSKSAKRKRRGSGRTASAKRPSSIRRRLLQQLRIIPPRPGQVYVGLPKCRGNANSTTSSASSSTSSLSSQRFHAGITPLRLYDSYDDLGSYDNSGDEMETTTNGELAVAAPVRHRLGLAMRSKFNRPSRDIAPPATLSGRVDILGPILNRQFILHHDRNIHITRDGTLIPSLPVNAAKLHFEKTSSTKKPDGTEFNNNNYRSTNNNVNSSRNNSPPRNGIIATDPDRRNPFNNQHLPNGEINGYARQTPSSPNGSNSTTSTAGSSFTNLISNNTSSGEPGVSAGPAIFDSSGTHSIPSWDADSNSRNDNELFAVATNLFPNICKPADSKQKSDDESQRKDEKSNSKRPPNSKAFTESRHNNDNDDEDYNIYSDIEEVPEEMSKEKNTKTNSSQDNESEIEVNKDRERDSDSEMVIDEESKIRRNSIDKEGQLQRSCLHPTNAKPVDLSIFLPADNLLPITNTIEEYNVPSTESIPLPDSPPPTSDGGSRDTNEADSTPLTVPFLKVRNDILDISVKGKSTLREEYDPSQPLDSSDEEQHSMQLTTRSSLSGAEEEDLEKEDIEIPIPASPPPLENNDVPKPVREADEDLNSIPMPPTDDYRRPTIQFSIPTRHRLLPISSLIKRQKGVMRKESKNGNPLSFQSEISKIFGDEKGDEIGGDWSKLDSSEEKLSLVAEIFGSDDEEGDIPLNDIRIVGPASILENDDASKGNDSERLDETATSSIPTVANSRWKTIAEPNADALEALQAGVENDLPPTVEDPAPSSIDETPEIEVLAVKEAEVVVLQNLTKVNKLKDTSSRYENRESESPVRKEATAEDIDNGNGDKSNSSLESISDEDSFDSDSSTHKNGEGGKTRRRRDTANGRSHKRKRSHSLTSNCEEGEIVDVPEKKKKKGKKKKSKKRKKGKESRSPSVINFTEKKLPDAQARHSSSDEQEDRSKPVSWRKPSKSTKQRNYRDGKPKAEEKYFRENDKHREGSPRERRDREKHPKEKSPARESKRERSKERTESRRTPEESKNHSSRSKSHRWRSRSRSASKSKKHYGSPSGKKQYSSRSESRNSPVKHSRRHRRSKSPVRGAHSRSHSKSPGKFRSHSPVGKSRRRSRSDSRNRRNKRRKSLSTSSSRSISSKRSKGRRKDRFGTDDRLRKRRERDREKDKDREKEKDKDKEKEREKVVEVRETKDKKKKRKRREKSVSPVKAIVADGDSIVVSLNFQKGKDSSSTNNTESTSTNKADDTSKRKSSKSKNGRSGEKESGKPKMLKKTVLIDLEASPIQEQNIGVSPTVIVLSDDDDNVASQSKEKDSEDKHVEDKTTSGAVTNAVIGSSGETGERGSPYRHGHGVAADSTQVQPQSTCKIGDASFSASMSTSGSPDEGSNGSLMRDDTVVTSTRGSVETAHPPDEESMNSCSPSSKNATKSKMGSSFQSLSPKAATPLPLNSSPTYRNEQGSTPSSTATTIHKTNGQTLTPASTSMGMTGKPVIGNIPGLFPSKSSNLSGGNVSVPSPIVIPTPPAPQLRFPAMNPTLLNSNVLVSVASAIYGPLLAARQQSSVVRNMQPNQIPGNTLGNVIAVKNNLQGTVLLPKNQNFHTFNSRTNNVSTQPSGDGDSPFSPNSSEGDDLFEPPNDRGQIDSVSSSKNDKSSSVNSAPTTTSGHIGGGLAATGGKVKSTLFDNLFGASPNKSVHGKLQDRMGKLKSAHQKAKGHRQTVKKEVKLSEGELRLSEDVPTSAVELRVKEKFLKKLNRQERVVEEVKLSLKPHYSKKHITKDEYKEILRKAVPKICHNKSGEINPNKIKELVEAYVKKFRHSRKKE